MPIQAIVFIATDNFLPWLSLAVACAMKSNPHSTIYIYDLTGDKSRLIADYFSDSEEIHVIPWGRENWRWPSWADSVGFDFFWPNFKAREQVKYLFRRLRFLVTGKKKSAWLVDKGEFVEQKRNFIRINCQKPLIFRDFTARWNIPFCYVDADAMLLKDIDGCVDGDFDLGVTVMDPDQLRLGVDSGCGNNAVLPYMAINAGVFFVKQPETMRRIVEDWLAILEATPHTLSEQTAISVLIQTTSSDDAPFVAAPKLLCLSLRSASAMVKTFPCSTHNFCRMKPHDVRFPDNAAIVHFVGSLKQKEHWPAVEALVQKYLAA
ncbi:MAG: putative nucleotide-diphospho-sugar transferase [Georgfuchsia sp.]